MSETVPAEGHGPYNVAIATLPDDVIRALLRRLVGKPFEQWSKPRANMLGEMAHLFEDEGLMSSIRASFGKAIPEAKEDCQGQRELNNSPTTRALLLTDPNLEPTDAVLDQARLNHLVVSFNKAIQQTISEQRTLKRRFEKLEKEMKIQQQLTTDLRTANKKAYLSSKKW